MGETTGISWTDHTWNPWHGCIKISSGCKLCYMYRDKERYGQDPTVVMRSKTKFTEPLAWKSGRVFTCSWSDFFIEQADEWRDDAWDVIRRTPHLTYQILTKRPERIAGHLPADWGSGWPHVWLGVSVESQKYADERIPVLLQTPAVARFLSVEPQLENVDILRVFHSRWPHQSPPTDLRHAFRDVGMGIDWVICGGESGPKARPFNTDWAESLLAQCRAAGVAFFLKQLGAHVIQGGERRIKKDRAGADMHEWPHELRVQEFPGRSGAVEKGRGQ